MFKKIARTFSIESMANTFEQAFGPDFVFDGESHNFIEIVYIHSGKVEISENDKIYILEGGDMIFHAPMEFHRIKSAAGTSPRICNLSIIITGEAPSGLYDGVFGLDAGEREEYTDIFKAAEKVILGKSDSAYASQYVGARLEAFIINICEKGKKHGSPVSDAGALMYRRLVGIMNDGIYDNISLTELAERSYISVSYVKALFGRYAGTSPGSYYARLQALEAARLIDRGIPFARIAEMMNFSSPNYFSLFFKKQMGQTPSEYKRRRDD